MDNYTRLMRALIAAKCDINDDAKMARRIFADHKISEDRAFMIGVRELVKRWRKANLTPAEIMEREARNESIEREANAAFVKRLNIILGPVMENERKAKQYDKIVQLFDTWMVGDTKLGDCTKTKLLTESAKLQQASVHAARHAALYKRLAASLGARETVRTTANRKTILDVLLEDFDSIEKVAA